MKNNSHLPSADTESRKAPNLRLSLQTEEEYHSYSAVHVPSHYYTSLTPEEEIMNSLEQATAWARDQFGSRAVQSII